MFFASIKITSKARLQDEMRAMRTWLDHRRIEPAKFRQLRVESEILFCVYFDHESEAKAFAEDFGGQIESHDTRSGNKHAAISGQLDTTPMISIAKNSD